MAYTEQPPSPYETGEPSPGAEWLRAAGRFISRHVIPVAATLALQLAMRHGELSLLPLNAGIERAYGNIALLLAVAAALVGSASFGREEARFDIPAVVATALAALVCATPFIVSRAGLTLGLPSRYFDVVAIYAYLGFSLVLGLLLSGCWSVVVRAARDARSR